MSSKVPLGQVEQLAHLISCSVIASLGVKFIVNRAVTHEIVRHRPCSFLQESQRYCRYSQDKFANQVSFIRPLFFAPRILLNIQLWQQAMEVTESLYLQLLETSTPRPPGPYCPIPVKPKSSSIATLRNGDISSGCGPLLPRNPPCVKS